MPAKSAARFLAFGLLILAPVAVVFAAAPDVVDDVVDDAAPASDADEPAAADLRRMKDLLTGGDAEGAYAIAERNQSHPTLHQFDQVRAHLYPARQYQRRADQHFHSNFGKAAAGRG